MAIRLDAHGPEFLRKMPPQLPVRVATTASITIATDLNVGDTIDGVVLAAGDRVLVKNQGTGSQNGIYSAGATPERTFDMLEGLAAYGALIYVVAGTANGGKVFKNTNTSVPTIGTTALTFAEFGSGGGLIIEEVDGAPSVTATELVFPNGTLGVVGTVATYTPATPGSTVDIEDEGAAEGAADTIDFTGAGVSVTFAAGTATVDIPGGAGGGNVVAQTGTVTIHGLAGDAAREPASPDADDDEFNTTDTSDPMTGWTTLGTPTAHNMNSTALSHYYVSKNAGSLSLTGIYKAQSSPFTVVAKVSDFIIGTDVQARIGIFVGQATPGNVSSVSRAVSGSVISQDNWSNPTTFSSSGATTGAVDMMTCPLYFKIIVTSTSNVAYYYSLNGLLWRPVLTGHNPGFTIGSAGLFIDPSSAGAAVEACFDYIRFS